jgi:hypothetical protein
MMELSPKSKAFVDVRFSHDGFGWEPVGVIKMVLDPPSRINAIMEIDPTAARCRYPSTNWKKIETEFDLDAILDMMRTTGIDPGDPNAIADAKEMEQIVRDIAAGKSTVFGPVWSSTHVNRWVTASRPKWYVAATYGAWAIVALIVILRCNRKGPVAR